MIKKDAKATIDKLRASGAIDAVDGQAWTEELLGFTKSPSAASGNATAMDLAIKSINQIKAIETKYIEGGKSPAGEKIEGEAVTREIAKRNRQRDQLIIDLEAWEKAETRTPTEINEYAEALLAPQKEAIAREVVKRRWFQGVTGAEYGRWYPSQVEKKKSPYPEYPDAYQENGDWFVMKGKDRYRINP